jgi:hypothetical protein
MVVLGLIIGIACYVVQSLFMMKLFKKANVAAWKAWVPFVNIWTFLQLGGQKGQWTFGVIGAIGAYVLITIFVAIMAFTAASGASEGSTIALSILTVLLYIAAFAGCVLTTVFQCIAAYNIGKKLGFDSAMVVLYIFVGIVWLGIAGLGSAKFDNKQGKPSLAPTVK